MNDPSPYDENKKGKEMSFLFPFCFHGAVLNQRKKVCYKGIVLYERRERKTLNLLKC